MIAWIQGNVTGWNDIQILELSMSFLDKGNEKVFPVTWKYQKCMDLTLREKDDTLFLLKMENIHVNGKDASGFMWAFKTAKLRKMKVKLYGQGKKQLDITRIWLYDRIPGKRSETMDLCTDPKSFRITYRVKREASRWRDPVLVLAAGGPQCYNSLTMKAPFTG